MPVLLDYITSLNNSAHDSVIVVPGSETALHSSLRLGMLRDHGLISPVQLHVTWNVASEHKVISYIMLHMALPLD